MSVSVYYKHNNENDYGVIPANPALRAANREAHARIYANLNTWGKRRARADRAREMEQRRGLKSLF